MVNFRRVGVYYMSTTNDKINVYIVIMWILMGNAIMASVKIILTVSVFKYQSKY